MGRISIKCCNLRADRVALKSIEPDGNEPRAGEQTEITFKNVFSQFLAGLGRLTA